MDGIESKTIGGIGWSALGKWGSQLINLIVLIIFARILGPNDFGLIAMANIFVNIILVFLDQGYNATIVQRKTIDSDVLNTAFLSNIIVGAVFTVIGVSISGSISKIYQEPNLTQVIQFLSLNFLILSFGGIQQAVLRRNFNFGSLAKGDLISACLGGIVGISLAFSGLGVFSLVSQILVSSFIKVIVFWWISDWKPALGFSWVTFLDLSKFGINIIGNRALSFFDLQFDELLIGYIFGSNTLGYYSIGKSLIIRLAGFISGATTTVTMSLFSTLQDSREKLVQAYLKIIEYTAFVVIPLFLGILTISSEIIVLLFGVEWEKSAPILMWIAPAGILLSMLHYNENIVIAIGYPNKVFKFRLFNTLLRVILIVIASTWGVNFIALAILFTSLVLMSSSLKVVHDVIEVGLIRLFSTLSYSVLSGVLMAGVVLLVKNVFFSDVGSLLTMISMILLAGLTYLGSVSLFRPQAIPHLFELGREILHNYKTA